MQRSRGRILLQQLRLAVSFRVLKGRGYRRPTQADGEGVDALSDTQAMELADAIDGALGAGADAEIAVRVAAESTERLVTRPASPMFPDDPIRVEERTIGYWRKFSGYARRGGFTVTF